jgi:dihydroorotate dehydrogenase (NAD+) catalytic subunit
MPADRDEDKPAKPGTGSRKFDPRTQDDSDLAGLDLSRPRPAPPDAPEKKKAPAPRKKIWDRRKTADQEAMAEAAKIRAETRALKAAAARDREAGDYKNVDLGVSIGPLRLVNPVVAASGTFGYGLELGDFCPPRRLGAVVTKGLSLRPWSGNAQPRMVETAGGLMNAIGLENIGVEEFLASVARPLGRTAGCFGANIIGAKVEEYEALAGKLSLTKIDFIEVNVSCPNLAHPGGMSFGSDPEVLFPLVGKVVAAAAPKPVIVKLPPLVADIAGLAKICESAGATAISLINTLPGLAVDFENRRSMIANGFGGLSGPPVKPLALRQVYLAARAVKIPVVGMGGIMSGLDALEFIACGASAVQVGTAILQDPAAPLRIIAELKRHLGQNKLTLEEVRGSLRL